MLFCLYTDKQINTESQIHPDYSPILVKHPDWCYISSYPKSLMGNSMKKITLLTVITFTFLFTTTSWVEWNYVTENERGNKFYYDKDRVRKSGKYLYFWELINLGKSTEFGDLSYTTYKQLDCSIFIYKILKSQSYNKPMGEGEMRGEETPPDEWRYPKPDSVGESTYNKICEEQWVLNKP